MIFTFVNNVVSVGSVALSSGTATVSSSAIGPNPDQFSVTLTEVDNDQFVGVTLSNVQDSSGANIAMLQGLMGVLIGDTGGNSTVNASDVSQTKSQSGRATTAANFRTDVTANGVINSSDIGLVKINSGTSLP